MIKKKVGIGAYASIVVGWEGAPSLLQMALLLHLVAVEVAMYLYLFSFCFGLDQSKINGNKNCRQAVQLQPLEKSKIVCSFAQNMV